MDSSRAFWEQRYRHLHVTPAPPSVLAHRAFRWLQGRVQKQSHRPVVVDLGAGGSLDAALFARLDATVVAVDFVARALEHLPPTVHRLVADLRTPLPLRSDSVDLAYTHLVVSCAFYNEEIVALFGEVYRVLVPGGTFWVLARSTDDPTCRYLGSRGPGYYDLAGTGLHFFSKKHLRRYLNRFVIEEIAAVELQQHDERYNAIVARARKGGNSLVSS